jgi:hypothetical protein
MGTPSVTPVVAGRVPVVGRGWARTMVVRRRVARRAWVRMVLRRATCADGRRFE